MIIDIVDLPIINGGSFQFANRKCLPGRVSKIGENQPRGKHKQFDPENH